MIKDVPNTPHRRCDDGGERLHCKRLRCGTSGFAWDRRGGHQAWGAEPRQRHPRQRLQEGSREQRWLPCSFMYLDSCGVRWAPWCHERQLRPLRAEPRVQERGRRRTDRLRQQPHPARDLRPRQWCGRGAPIERERPPRGAEVVCVEVQEQCRRGIVVQAEFEKVPAGTPSGTPLATPSWNAEPPCPTAKAPAADKSPARFWKPRASAAPAARCPSVVATSWSKAASARFIMVSMAYTC